METKNKNQVSVNTSEFVFSHGREPKGRGSWAFGFGVKHPNVCNPEECRWFDGTYAQARRAAVAAAASEGVSVIYVQP